MRPRHRALVALSLGLLPASVARPDEPPAPAPIPVPTTFALAGRAMERPEHPLAGRVVVTPSMPAGPAREATLDAEGRFEIDGLPRATVTVEVFTSDGLTLRTDGVGLPRAAPLAITVPPDLRTIVGGVVRDAGGRPVSGATVRSWATTGYGAVVDATTTTADDGTYALRVHPEGWLRVEAPGFATASRLVFRAQGAFATRLARSPTVSGRVRRANGTPAAGTTIWARALPNAPGDPLATRAQPATAIGTSDAKGAFGPLPLARGRWTVFALGSGFVSAELAAAPLEPRGAFADVVPGADRALDLVVTNAAAITGIVLDDAGRRVTGAEVTAEAPAPSSGPTLPGFDDVREAAGPAAKTDADGRFTLDGLVPGRPVVLVARRDGVAGPASAPIVPKVEASEPRTLTVPVLRSLEVRAVDPKGRPIADALVSAPAGPAFRIGVTGDDGIALLGGVPAGGVPIAVRPFGAVVATTANHAVPREGAVPACVVRVDRGGEIAGRIEARLGITPSGLSVSAFGPLGPGRRTPATPRDGAVRADGTFVVGGLEPGRYRVVAGTNQAFPRLEGEVEVEAGTDDARILLDPAKDWRGDGETPTFEVRVVDPEGRRVPLARGVADFEGRGVREFDVEAGSAVLDADAPRARVRVRFALDADGRPLPLAPADVEITPEAGQTVTIPLAAERTIAGRVLGTDGRPAAGVEVRAQVPGPDPFTAFHAKDVASSIARTDADGRFVLGQLGARTYDVEVPASPGALAATIEDVRAGAADVVVRRRRAVDVTVIVEDPKGKPVAGATVRWTAPPRVTNPARPEEPVLPWAYDPPERTTDASGRVRFLGLDPEQRVRLEAWPPRARGDVRPSSVDGWSPADTTVRLPFGLAIRGVVRAPDGKPIPWAQIRAERDGEHVGFDEVDGAGRFVLDGLAPGPVRVTATLLGVHSAGRDAAQATVEAGTDDLVLVVDPGPTLVVRAEGRAFPGVDDAHRVGGGWTEARLYDEGPDGDETYGHVEGGTLVFRELRPGRPYTLWIPWTKETGGTYLERGASLVVGERTIVLEAGAPIGGTIDRTRVTPFRPRVWSGPAPEGIRAVRGPVRLRGSMKDEGEFEFPPLPSGRWRIEAFLLDGAGTGSYEVKAEVEAGATVELTPVKSPPR